MVGVSPVELEEFHEIFGDDFFLHLFADVHSPLDEFFHRNFAVAVFVRRLHQEGERLLLARVRVVVEFVACVYEEEEEEEQDVEEDDD